MNVHVYGPDRPLGGVPVSVAYLDQLFVELWLTGRSGVS
jgi:hypothetical protein